MKVSPLTVTVVSLSSLTIFLLPLIALLLSYDAIVGEHERGTLALLLAYPVARWQVIVGKFLGHVTILALATVAGLWRSGCRFGGYVERGAGGVGRVRRPDRLLDPAWRGVHRDRLSRQRAGARPRHGGRACDRGLAVVRH